jgi:hypothetical protein
VARWQIWLGKWLGIMFINAMLLGLSGGAVYLLLWWRVLHLPREHQQALRNEVLVARGSAKEQARDLEPIVDQIFRERFGQATPTTPDQKYLRDQVHERVKAEFQLIRPGFGRRWRIELGLKKNSLRDQPLFLRVKFTTTQLQSTVEPPKTYPTFWQVGEPETARLWRQQMNLAADTFHEFKIPPNLFDEHGTLTIECLNPNNTDLLFLLEDGMEVLYYEGGFGLNYLRGLGIIFCWLALLAALGLAAASFLSFPVAAFLSLSVLIVALSSGTLAQVVQEGGISGVNHDTGKIEKPMFIDRIVVPLFTGLLKLVNLIQDFSPIDWLSTGRSITWGKLAQAVGQIILLMGGLLSAIGIVLFTRRELATAQGTQ